MRSPPPTRPPPLTPARTADAEDHFPAPTPGLRAWPERSKGRDLRSASPGPLQRTVRPTPGLDRGRTKGRISSDPGSRTGRANAWPRITGQAGEGSSIGSYPGRGPASHARSAGNGKGPGSDVDPGP